MTTYDDILNVWEMETGLIYQAYNQGKITGFQAIEQLYKIVHEKSLLSAWTECFYNSCAQFENYGLQFTTYINAKKELERTKNPSKITELVNTIIRADINVFSDIFMQAYNFTR